MILCFSQFKTSAQQTPHHTHYVFNTQLYNPAYVATKDFVNLTLSSRLQWNGIEDAPETHALSAFKNFEKSNLGLGGSFMLDRIGPVAEKKFNIDAAYTITPNDKSKLAFGIKLSGETLDLNVGEFSPADSGDPLLTPADTKFKPNIGAGAYWYGRKWYLGTSVLNLLHNKYFDNSNKSIERPHYYFIGGYIFEINREFKIKPAVITKVVSGSPVSINISASMLFNDSFSAGLSYNNGNSISALLSTDLAGIFTIGYAFDYALNSTSKFSSGSHEVVLSYRFTESRKARDCQSRFF